MPRNFERDAETQADLYSSERERVEGWALCAGEATFTNEVVARATPVHNFV